MKNFERNFNNFASEMMLSAYSKFKETDTKYQEIVEYLDKNKDKFDNIINNLNKEDKDFVMEYISNICYEESCPIEYIYLSGYEDCALLLRRLGVI